MTEAEEDLAAVYSAMGVNSANPRAQAIAEIERLCNDFLTVAAQLREVTQKCFETKEPEATLLASRERLTATAWCSMDAVHAAQRKWMLKGVDVYVAHDRNGSPIRVDKQTRKTIIGFN